MRPSVLEDSCVIESGSGVGADTASIGVRALRAVFYVFVLLIPIENVTLNGADAGFTFAKLIGLVLFGLALINWRVCFRRLPAAFWMVAWYLAAYSLSQLWIPGYLDPRFREIQATMIQMLALFLISANLFRDARFRAALLRFYSLCICLIAVGMLLGVIGNRFAGIEGRDSVLGQDPNGAAGLFTLGAICIAGDPRIFASRRFIARFVASLLAVSILVMAIIKTGSRGGLIDFVSGVLGLAICGAKTSRMRRLLIAGAVIGLLGVMVVREFKQGTVASTRMTAAWENGDTAGRTAIYNVAWPMFLAKPLLGYGGANNFFILGERLNESLGALYYRDTHNLLLAVLTEVGLIGGLPFLAAIFYALWKAWRYGRRTDDARSFSLMLVLITINISLTWDRQKLFWIVFAAAVACGLELDAAEKNGVREPVFAEQTEVSA
jgi:O-antigen ligase